MPRAARRATLIPGIGGYLLVKRPEGRDDLGIQQEEINDISKFYESGAFLLDVLRWRVRHRYIFAPSTTSGSNGAVNRIVVAQDWEFDAELNWNAADFQRYDSEAIGFMEQILLGNRNNDWQVSILFQIGDPLSYPNTVSGLGMERRAGLFGPYALLEYGEMINDGTPSGGPASVVKAMIHGVGNDLLYGVRGGEVMFNRIDEASIAPAPVPV